MIPTRDRITVKQTDGLDDWGRPIAGASVSYPCRIDYRNEITKDDNGEEVLSKVQILIKGFAPVSTEDTVSWVDGYGTHEVNPISVSPIKDITSKVIFTKVVS